MNAPRICSLPDGGRAVAVVEVRLLGNMNDQLSQLTELHDREGNLFFFEYQI